MAVVESLGRREDGERSGIASQFAIGLEARHDEPHERIEPMQRLHGGGGPVPKEIAMTNVEQFVKQDVAQAALIKPGLPVFRKENLRLRGCRRRQVWCLRA